RGRRGRGRAAGGGVCRGGRGRAAAEPGRAAGGCGRRRRARAWPEGSQGDPGLVRRDRWRGVGAGRAVGGGPRAGPAGRGQREQRECGRDGDSLLAAAAGAGGLSDREVVSNAAVLMFGGIETTEGMICNAVLYLLGQPGQVREVIADHHLAGNAVEESLRLEPAAAVVDRYATADVRLGGAPIQRGDLVTVSLAG